MAAVSSLHPGQIAIASIVVGAAEPAHQAAAIYQEFGMISFPGMQLNSICDRQPGTVRSTNVHTGDKV